MPPNNQSDSPRRTSSLLDDSNMRNVNLERNDPANRPASKEAAELTAYEREQHRLALDPNIIRKAGKVPPSAWFIIVCELCERFSYYGASLIFQTYMLGELGLGKSEATALNRGFVFFCYATAILGAFIADVFWGKFKTIVVFSSVYIVGLVLLAASSTHASISAGFGLAGFILASYVFIASGTGGIKSNVSAFAAEQVRAGIHETSTAGVYEDSRLTVESVFRYFYWAINVGALVGQSICPAISHHSFPIAFTIPAIIFVIGIAVFILGRKRYVATPPDGGILGKVFSCIGYALKNRNNGVAVEHWLDRSKVGGQRWDARFVDDLKRTIKGTQVFLFYPFYWALYGNMSDNLISQGINMHRPDWLGPEQLNALNSLTIVIAIPFFDAFIFPLLRRLGFRLGPITRITIGFLICTASFVYVTVLQHFLYQTGPYFDLTNVPKEITNPVNDLSVWWQMPPYIIVAISEIFASATGLEFAFQQAAPELKSIVVALYLLTNCGGSLIGMVFAPITKDPLMVILFGAQTTMLGIIAIIFYALFRKLDDVDV